MSIDKDFPIVGVGASAGGLAAFEAFFSGMPADSEPGMAFVLVQHLAPDHDSMLTELIQRYTRMKVFEVEDGMRVQINCAYIIPPNRDMAFLNGTLQLIDPVAPRGHRMPIDFLFRSLAQDRHEKAIGIVLSGTGSDGTLGARIIKSEGGMVMAQDPDHSEFDGMPRSVIAAGMVDFAMKPAEMPAKLMAYVDHAYQKTSSPTAASILNNDVELKKICVLLHTQTGHDFSQYKTSTIYRRIERRMAVHQVDTIEHYVMFLQKTPIELEALFRDLLIGVTSFFRDPEAFSVFEEQVVPALFKGKPPGSVIRIWSTGCSTGEEAYSIAILLQEHLEVLKQSYKIQIFATDIDSRAIAVARTGIYPASIAGDISPERLARFFTADLDGSVYRIHKSIRDMLVFSEHDLVKDPPFSKMDLISCRNLLIYMGSALQKKIISVFHYALIPNGMLFLGTSETVGEYTDMFAALDRKSKIFQRKEYFHDTKRAMLGRVFSSMLPMTVKDSVMPAGSDKTMHAMKRSLREITEQALLQYMAPVGALVNAQGDILYLHGRSGLFLEPMPGDAGINNILKMAREGLRRDLTSALQKAAGSKSPVRVSGLRVNTNGHFTPVNLTVCPVAAGQTAALGSPLYLVVLERVASTDLPAEGAIAPPAVVAASGLDSAASGLDSAASSLDGDISAQIRELNEELQAKEEYLRAANEELETSNEELKSSNEEMQSVNEELQSTNEELETSKEELQSINEELATVNTELQSKVTDLSRANNDMNNLLAGTGIGTVFVDHQLNILRFTPNITLIINLIISDIGRPVGHIVSNMVNYNNLVVDVQTVLETLVPKEIDVQTHDGKYYTMRILPYRTLDNVIEGAVITFVDVTETVHTREALRIANALLQKLKT